MKKCQKIASHALPQVEEGAALVFNSSDGELYNLWFREALPTYGGPLRYRAHLDCDRCRRDGLALSSTSLPTVCKTTDP